MLQRLTASSEVVMLARMWDTDERQAIAKDKEELAKAEQELAIVKQPTTISSPAPNPTPSLSEAMPPPPPPPQPTPLRNPAPSSSSSEFKEEPLKEEKDEKFLGLKFSRSQSGNWKPNKEEESEDPAYDEIEAIKQELASCSNDQKNNVPLPPAQLSNLATTSASPPVPIPSTSAMSDSDEDFSLKDVDTDKTVGSILAGGAEEEEEGEVLDLPNLGEAGDDDVQSAINSILDIQGDEGRIETPDFNNLAGLLDSMEEGADEQDPVTEAAVNSIL